MANLFQQLSSLDNASIRKSVYEEEDYGYTVLTTGGILFYTTHCSNDTGTRLADNLNKCLKTIKLPSRDLLLRRPET